jgi:uncharacterized protein DUF6186
VSPYAVLAAGFTVLFAVAVAVELLGRARRGPFRPLGAVLHRVLAHPVGRWVLLAAWLWIGVHFLAR